MKERRKEKISGLGMYHAVLCHVVAVHVVALYAVILWLEAILHQHNVSGQVRAAALAKVAFAALES